MDLADDFPNDKIYEAQEIIHKLDAMIKDIEDRRASVNKIKTEVDNEGKKLDFIIGDVCEVKESMVKSGAFESSLNKLEKKIDDMVDHSHVSVLCSAIVAFSVGVIVGFVIKKITYRICIDV